MRTMRARPVLARLREYPVCNRANHLPLLKVVVKFDSPQQRSHYPARLGKLAKAKESRRRVHSMKVYLCQIQTLHKAKIAPRATQNTPKVAVQLGAPRKETQKPMIAMHTPTTINRSLNGGIALTGRR